MLGLGLSLGLAPIQGVRALYAVPDVLASPPTATWKGSNTSSIPSAVSINGGNAAWRYLNKTSVHASTYLQASPDAGMAFVVETVTSADDVDLRFIRFNSKINVFVNDAPISATLFSTDSAGAADLLQLRFAGTPLEGASKRITIVGFNVMWNGAYITAGKTAALPSVIRPIVAILGDSYTQGTGAEGIGMSYARWCFRALGYDFYPEGVGGTGYLTAAGATAAATRMTNRIGVIPHAPTRIALCLGYNDAGGDLTTLAANHAATIAAANAAWPGVPVDTWGPWTPKGTTTNLGLVKAALIASAAANGSRFIDIEDIVNAANSATFGVASEAPNYVHPNAALGHPYLGAQMALRGRAAGMLV